MPDRVSCQASLALTATPSLCVTPTFCKVNYQRMENSCHSLSQFLYLSLSMIGRESIRCAFVASFVQMQRPASVRALSNSLRLNRIEDSIEFAKRSINCILRRNAIKRSILEKLESIRNKISAGIFSTLYGNCINYYALDDNAVDIFHETYIFKTY